MYSTFSILIGVLIIFLICILIHFIPIELRETKTLNNKFNNIRQNNNNECINYLYFLTGRPKWRISLIFSILLSLFLTSFLILIFKLSNIEVSNTFLLLLFQIILFVSFFFKNLMIGYLYYHYICDGQCKKNN